jgi:LPPG:FO 2-phospho-L-lactate transferase
MKITALAGGVGGAKLADGLARVLPPEDLAIIVNTGDDFEYDGLKISPDLDTVCYTLAGLANPDTGWGRKEESWNVLAELERLGSPTWFHLGDRDIATHLERTRRLARGEKLSEVTRSLCEKWGIRHPVYPMTDDPVATKVITASGGELDFQEYFVRDQCQPAVTGFRFAGVEDASPAAGVLDALTASDLVVFCPSNPWVSIGPILEIRGIREALQGKPVIAVSPIIAGKALKGPAAKMYAELGFEPSALAVARQYGGILTGFILDQQDAGLCPAVSQCGIICLATDTIMVLPEDRMRLARDLIRFGSEIIERENHR